MDIRMSWLAVGCLCVLPAVGGAVEARQQPSAPTPYYPLQLLSGSRLLLDARVNDHDVQALLDSAAEATLLDHAFARRIGLLPGEAVQGKGSGAATFDAQLVKGVSLEAVGVTLRGQEVAVADLADVGQRLLHRPIDAILGRELFDAARLEIDVGHRRIRVLAPGEQPRGRRLGLATEHGVETVPVAIEGHAPVRATFDLGNGAQVLVGRAYAQRLGLLADGRAVHREAGGGLGGEAQRETFVLRSLVIAGRRFDDVAAAIDPQDSASDLNVGLSVLRHFVVTTDFHGRAVWLRAAR
jgi:hypothetical protein